MDIHPLLVHFPIALLSVYGIMELIWSKKLRENETWFYIKASFLLLGVIGAFFSLASGDAASHYYTNKALRPVIEVHETWASTATTLFSILAASYLITWIAQRYQKHIAKIWGGKLFPIWKLLTKINDLLAKTPLRYVLALAALLSILITGALGGVLVYGTNADPIVHFVYTLFF